MMASIGNDRHKETPKYQFLENCHKNDLNEVTDCLSCGTVQKQTDTCDEYHVPMKLSEFPQAPKLRGGGKPKNVKSKSPQYANTNNQELQKLITLIRSLGLWKSLEHKKCNIPKKKIRDNLCSYCLVRSCVVKLNWLLNYY